LPMDEVGQAIGSIGSDDRLLGDPHFQGCSARIVAFMFRTSQEPS
jgi:hypothetical protein